MFGQAYFGTVKKVRNSYTPPQRFFRNLIAILRSRESFMYIRKLMFGWLSHRHRNFQGLESIICFLCSLSDRALQAIVL